MKTNFTVFDVYRTYHITKALWNDTPIPRISEQSLLARGDYYEFKELTKTLKRKRITPEFFFQANFVMRNGEFYPHMFNKAQSFKNYIKYMNMFHEGRLDDIVRFELRSSLKAFQKLPGFTVDYLALSFENKKISKTFLAFLVFELRSEVAKKVAILYRLRGLVQYYWIVKRVLSQDEWIRLKATINEEIDKKIGRRANETA